MITTVFLDNDGVLVDTERCYCEANQDTCRRYGYELVRAEYQRLFLSSGAGLREVASRLNWSDATLAAVRVERDNRYETLLRTREIALPGIREGLFRLSTNFELCVVTSSPRAFFDIIHERTGFVSLFSAVLCEEDVTHHKPDPEPYRLAMERTGVEARQGIAIEDSARGLRSAAAAGLECVVVPRELTKDQNFSGAVAVVPSFLDAVTLVEQMAGRGSTFSEAVADGKAA
ncbi:MAG: HAD family phosphatase [Chitinispirillaceae bacterium]|nr:HAD family phosphatase [Chitinispirillaceae bacterium]